MEMDGNPCALVLITQNICYLFAVSILTSPEDKHFINIRAHF